MEKKVIIVRSNPISPDPRVDKEAKSLSNNGFEVLVLGRDKEDKYGIFEDRQQYKIYRYNHKIGSYSIATFKTIFLPFSIFIWGLYELVFLLKNQWDIVHACDFDTLIPAIIAAKIKRKKIVYDIFDVYGDMLDSTGIPRWVLNFLRHLEEFFIQFTDVTILADESRKKQLKNAKYNKLVIIMNASKMPCKPQIKKDRVFRIFYGGLIGKERGLLQIIDAIKDSEDIELIIAGFGYDEQELVPLFEQANNIKFLGRISHEKVLELTAKSDLLFALYDTKIPNNKFASPNKLFESMACSKPIIVNENTSMAEIVEKENCGIIVPYDDINEIRKEILLIKNDENLRLKLGKNAELAFKNRYNWNIMEKRLLMLYKDLIT